MILEALKSTILQNIGSLKPAPKQWFKRNCPLCVSRGHSQDTRTRFGIQFENDSILMNCFNCGFSSSFTENSKLSTSFKVFLKSIHIDQKFIDYIDFEIFKNYNNIEVVREGDNIDVTIEKLKVASTKWKAVDLPRKALPIMKWLEQGCEDRYFLEVARYMMSRNILDLSNFYWCPDTNNNLNKRVIIPYYYKSKTVGYTARLCYDTTEKKIPKYYQQCPNDFIYNLDNQQDWDRKYVILTEGVLDAYVTDGISILGETTQTKIDLVKRINKQIIVSPDRDNKGGDLVTAAIQNDWAVSFPKWDINIKDAAAAAKKYGRLLTVHSIIDSAVYNKEQIRLQWDIESHERIRREK
jgi:hypothetical protein